MVDRGFMQLGEAERDKALYLMKNEAAAAQRRLDKHRMAHAAALLRELWPDAVSASVYLRRPDSDGRRWDAEAEITMLYDERGEVLFASVTPDEGTEEAAELHRSAQNELAAAHRYVIGAFGLDLRSGEII